MQLNTVKRDIATSGTMEVSTAKIKATSKLFDMFADQTYANKPVAILRELVANGVDAHRSAGKVGTPVEVSMPSEFDPMFKVKDFGTGMAHDFVMGPFMEYTNGSTKDGSDLDIGGFGIGSKSPFAYTDQFTLRVVHEGVLSVYTMFKNEEGIPSVGLQGQKTTSEPNGVEVSFPVEMDDMEDFRQAAQTALQYFVPLPNVIGGEITAPEYTAIGKDKTWAMKASADGTLGVIMGGVRYPVSEDSLNYSVRQSKIRPLLNYGIDLTVPIGTCDVAMSREALSYTDRTNTGIQKSLEAIVDEVAEQFSTKFDSAKSLWDARVMLAKELRAITGGAYYGNSPRAQMLISFAKWQGKSFNMALTFDVPYQYDRVQGKNVQLYPKGFPISSQYITAQNHRWANNGSEISPLKWEAVENKTINIDRFVAVLVDDMELAAKSRTRARIEEWLEANTTKQDIVVVFRAGITTDKTKIAELLKFIGSPSTVVYLSSLPEPVRKVRTLSTGFGTSIARPKTRMFKFTGKIDKHSNTITNLSPSWSKRDVVTEISPKDQPASGTMVTMSSFDIPKDLHIKMLLGLLKWEDLVFVNEGDAKLLKGTFKTFDEVFNPLFAAMVKKTKDLSGLLWVSQSAAYQGKFATIKYLKKGGLDKLSYNKTSTFGKIVSVYEKYDETFTPELRALATILKTKSVEPKDAPEALVKTFSKDHPFATQIEQLAGNYRLDRPQLAALFIRNL